MEVPKLVSSSPHHYDESFYTQSFVNDDPFDFPPGVRFCPTDRELIHYYLKRKVMNQILPPNKINEVNLYHYSPEELSGKYPTLGEKEWYFFTPRDRKYRNGNRPNRAAGSGYWKATGADKPIKHNMKVIGWRKALVFYEGRPPKGDKTNWIMHEYVVKEAPPPKISRGVNDMRLDEWVLCRIYKKMDNSTKLARKNEAAQPPQPSSPRQELCQPPNLIKDESFVYHEELGNKFNAAIPNDISCGSLAGDMGDYAHFLFHGSYEDIYGLF